MLAFSARAEFEAVAERLLDHHAAPKPMLAAFVLVLIGELRLAELLDHGAEQLIRDSEIEDGRCRGCRGPFQPRRERREDSRRAQASSDRLGHMSSSRQAASTPPRRCDRRRIPHRRCRQSSSACRGGVRASFPWSVPSGPRRSARSFPEAPWCARGCRAPAPPGAWSGRRWRRRSPSCRDRRAWPGAAGGMRPPARSLASGWGIVEHDRYSAACGVGE